MKLGAHGVAAVFALLLVGCSTAPVAPPPEIAASPWALESAAPEVRGVTPLASPWHHLTFPGKSPTQFAFARKDGRNAIAARAASSASMLRSRIRVEPADLGSVQFSWRVSQLISNADMALREKDDSPVRIVLVFEGDRARFSARDALLSELVHTVTGEELPYATLMYVWCNKRSPGSVITSARTSRIRTLVVESGPAQLNQWLDYERNIAADFRRAFGEPPGALVGIGVMSDSDNTQSVANAWFGPLRLAPATARLSTK